VATPKIGIIRGDGIGPELIDATLTVLEATAATGGPRLQTVEIDAGADTYRRTGTAMAPADLELIRTGLDATVKGPVGLPDVRMPDGTEAGPLGGIMRLGLDT
jgi:3-isopropylmalate dehydrogenase